MAELVGMSPLPLVNLVEEVAAEIRRRGLKRVALFGTRATMETALFGQLAGVADAIKPKPDEIDSIHETYLQLVSHAAGSPQRFRTLTQIAHTLVERDHVEAIVLAGTELSLVFDEGNTDFPHIDCATLHIEAIIRRLGSTG
jgi:aspartate racemase